MIPFCHYNLAGFAEIIIIGESNTYQFCANPLTAGSDSYQPNSEQLINLRLIIGKDEYLQLSGIASRGESNRARICASVAQVCIDGCNGPGDQSSTKGSTASKGELDCGGKV